jgi:glycyl-tRNA synthetase beta chain
MSHVFLVELGTEELPPVALKGLRDAFSKGLVQQLSDLGVTASGVKAYASPRRLALVITGLPATTPTKNETLWGPPVRVAFQQGQPTKAALAFSEKVGIPVADLQKALEGKEEKLCATVTQGGKTLPALLPDMVMHALAELPVPKRMRWGAGRVEFVRPAHWLVMLWDSEILPATLLGLQAGRVTYGHRFMAPGPCEIASATEYEDRLRERFVRADFDERRDFIQAAVAQKGRELGGQAVIEPDLLDEVTALNEWPCVLAGRFDPTFLSVPAQALISSMAEHQKYFHVLDAQQSLMPCFITVANIESRNPAEVIAGNEKVIRPRLSDAAFFFETDKKVSQADRREKLKTVMFQAQLGSLWDKTERMTALAEYLAPIFGVPIDLARLAAELSKADLVSGLVCEFTELQGIAGEYYARHQGLPDAVATAMREQYLPRFAGDAIPETPLGALLALVDRVDTLVGIFGLGQLPSGSKDPFALRRASISILRILVDGGYRLDMRACLQQAYRKFSNLPKGEASLDGVFDYLIERFKSVYSDAGVPAEVFQAVHAKGLSCPQDIDRRVKAVNRFATLADAQALAEANKRVNNILAKNALSADVRLDPSLFEAPAENTLATALKTIGDAVAPLIAQAKYEAALQAMAQLREPLDAFFTDVMVMVDNKIVQQNRLALLRQVQLLLGQVADIGCLVVKG